MTIRWNASAITFVIALLIAGSHQAFADQTASGSVTTVKETVAQLIAEFTGPTFTAAVNGVPRTWKIVAAGAREKLTRKDPSGRQVTYYGARSVSDKGEVVFNTCSDGAKPIVPGDVVEPTAIACSKQVLIGNFTAADPAFAKQSVEMTHFNTADLEKSFKAATTQNRMNLAPKY